MAKSMTAAQLLAKLEADPDYRKMRAEKDAALEARSAKLNAEAAPLLRDLEKAGFRVGSVYDLVNRSQPYRAAIPVLLRHLDQPYADWTRNGIARALAVPDAKYAWATLLAHYRAAPAGSQFKSGLAAALAATCDETLIEELAALARDRSNGSSRLLLLGALRRSRSVAALRTLAELRDDPEMAKEIASWSDPDAD